MKDVRLHYFAPAERAQVLRQNLPGTNSAFNPKTVRALPTELCIPAISASSPARLHVCLFPDERSALSATGLRALGRSCS